MSVLPLPTCTCTAIVPTGGSTRRRWSSGRGAGAIGHLALTDHDTAARRGSMPRPRPARPRACASARGVEVTAGWRGQSLHVIGPGLAPPTRRNWRLAGARAAPAAAAEIGESGWHGAGDCRMPSRSSSASAPPRAVPTRTHRARALVAAGRRGGPSTLAFRRPGTGRSGRPPSALLRGAGPPRGAGAPVSCSRIRTATGVPRARCGPWWRNASRAWRPSCSRGQRRRNMGRADLRTTGSRRWLAAAGSPPPLRLGFPRPAVPWNPRPLR